MKRRRRGPHAEREWRGGRSHVARSAMEEALSRAPCEVRATLDERARALARTPQLEAAPASERDVVVFRVAGECHAIDTQFVREILRARHITRVPRANGLFLGVINLRGEIVGVADLHRLLGFAAKPIPELPWLIVFGVERAEFAAAVETVESVRPVQIDRLADASAFAARPDCPFISGIGSDALVVLDGGALLADRRLFATRPSAADGSMQGEAT